MTRRTLFRRAQDAPRGRKIAAGALMLALLTATHLGARRGPGERLLGDHLRLGHPHQRGRHRHPTRSSSAPSSTCTQVGWITAIRFYKSKQNIGQHVGTCGPSSGQLLGTVTFTNESASGWQTANLPTPVCWCEPDHDLRRLVPHQRRATTPVTSTTSPARAPGRTPCGPSPTVSTAVPASTSTAPPAAFPTSTYRATNYYVDVAFKHLTDAQALATHHHGAGPRRHHPGPDHHHHGGADHDDHHQGPAPPRRPRRSTPAADRARCPCALTVAAKSCWATNTGVPGWTEAQIVAGQSPLQHVVGDRHDHRRRHRDRRTSGSTAASRSRPTTSRSRTRLIRTTQRVLRR